MKIGINLGETFMLTWEVYAGAMEYASHSTADVHIVTPRASVHTNREAGEMVLDGIVTRRPRPDLNIPQVIISSVHSEEGVSVTIDEDEVARTVVEHFISMGLTNLGFHGHPDWPISRLRWERFSRLVESLGGTPVFLEENDMDALKRIEKPCGIMATTDASGLNFIYNCQNAGFRVPGDFFVISVGNGPDCMRRDPKISTVAHSFSTVGYYAAKLCASMISGAPVESIKLPSSGLVLRESTTMVSDGMKTASEVAYFIRSNLSSPIQMADIVSRTNMSRRTLENLFVANYGVTPIVYLKTCRLDRAKLLLRTEDTPLKEIANACGYRDSDHICRVFKKHVGMSPLRYRKTHWEGK